MSERHRSAIRSGALLLSGAFVLLGAITLRSQVLAVPGEPLPNLTPVEFEEFRLGREDFVEVETAEEGLGPAFNGTSCAGCHNVPAVGGTSAIAEVPLAEAALACAIAEATLTCAFAQSSGGSAIADTSGADGAAAAQVTALTADLLSRVGLTSGQRFASSGPAKPVRGRLVAIRRPSAMCHVMLPAVSCAGDVRVPNERVVSVDVDVGMTPVGAPAPPAPSRAQRDEDDGSRLVTG